MGFRFRKSFKIAPGVRMNLSTTGVSASVGPRGASISMGSSGVYANAGLPGTGISYRKRLDGPSKNVQRSRTDSAQCVDMKVHIIFNEDGSVSFEDEDGSQLDERLVRKVRKEHKDVILAKLYDIDYEKNEPLRKVDKIHLDTPSLDFPEFCPHPFLDKKPKVPEPIKPSFFQRLTGMLFKSIIDDIEQQNIRSNSDYRQELDSWNKARSDHGASEAKREREFEQAMSGDLDACEAFLESQLTDIEWPRETLVSFELKSDGETLLLDVDLPEIEDMPSQTCKVSERSLKLQIKDISQVQQRKNYMKHIHAIGFRVIGTCFASLPLLHKVVLSGYSQRPDKKTGHIQDDYLYSVSVTREAWSVVNLEQIENIDVVECLSQFTMVRNMTKTGVFKAITPIAEG